MKLTQKAGKIYVQIIAEGTRLGDLGKIAIEIKKDHELAMELGSTGEFLPRQLAILIMDKKILYEDLINSLSSDMLDHEYKERIHLADWLMANQLTKDKKNNCPDGKLGRQFFGNPETTLLVLPGQTQVDRTNTPGSHRIPAWGHRKKY